MVKPVPNSHPEVALCFYPLHVKWNHGVALLSQLLADAGIGVEIWVPEKLSQFEATIAPSEVEFVGFSAVTAHDYAQLLPMIEMAKEMGKTTLLGGVYLGLGHPVTPAADHVCRGDGETLVDYLLWGDDELFRYHMVTQDLDALPLPDYESFKALPFVRGMPLLKGKKVVPYVSSRGCPYHCTFCQARSQPPPRVRRNVARDLRVIVPDTNPDIVYFCDALLPYWDEGWRESWEDWAGVPFVGYIRADIPEELLHWLVDRGMVGTMFGIESGSEWFRNTVYGKGITDADIRRTVGVLLDRGVSYVPTYIEGFPGAGLKERLDTAKMIHAVGGHPTIWGYEDLWKER